jgi:hypothetical protein
MKLESKLQVSLSKRADHVVLRRELAQLGSKSQLTEAIKRLIAAGRLVRLAPGVYAKARLGLQGAVELAAPAQVIADDILLKTGRPAVIRRIDAGDGPPQFEAEFTGVPATASAAGLAQRRRKPRATAFKLPRDVAQLPVKDVATYVANLASAHGVVFKRTRLDDFAEAVTRLAGDDERLDATGKLLASLRKKSVINGPQLARLMTNHMREQKNAVRSVR